MTDTIHSCSPYCDLPACVAAREEETVTHALSIKAQANTIQLLKIVISESLAALGTSSGCTPDASLEFMRSVPEEIRCTVAELRDRIAALEAENAELRAIVSGCVAALGTTAGCLPECSMEFMKGVPGEVAGTVAGLRRDAERLDYLQEHGSTVALVNIGYEGWDFQVGGLRVAVSPCIRAAIDAALRETP